MENGNATSPAQEKGGHRKGGRLWRILVVTIFLILFAGFMGLGLWQVQRQVWKNGLIERVDSRIHADPVAAPPPVEVIERDKHEYLRVRVTGRFRHNLETPVMSVSDLGPGWWILTPMETDQGFTVLVNRGFVPQEMKAADTRPTGPDQATVVGLLRLDEGSKGFMRDNDPAANNWFARQVKAILEARGVTGPVASYFIDAQQIEGVAADSWPRAGLTVVRFSNNHTVYALTWFGLAAGSVFAMVLVLRERRRRESVREQTE